MACRDVYYNKKTRQVYAVHVYVGAEGFEPPTISLKGSCSTD